jgi:hypothetical protein
MCRVAFVLMCFAPQLRYLVPQVGLATLVVGAMLAYVSLPWHRLPKSSIFFGAYFIAFGTFGLFVQLFGDILPGAPPARPLFFYALTTLALVLAGLAILRRPGGRSFVLNAMCMLLIVEIVIVGLQFSRLSFGVGLELGEDAARDHLIEGSYGNPNNVAVVLVMLLMILVISNYIRMSSLHGAALVVATSAATFVTLSRTALALLIAFIVVAMLTPMLRCPRLAATIRSVRRLIPLLVALGAGVLLLHRSGIATEFQDLAVVERSLARVSTLTAFGQDASVEWRMLVASRLVESLDSLGFGTMSDQNYAQYFNPLDPALAAINPHSYLVEMSFLFGYPGLIIALALLAVSVGRIIAAQGSSRILAVLFGLSVLFFQMVPSSLFPLDIFFLIVAIAGSRDLQAVERPVSR